jgi:hypothetical protein
MIADVLDGLVNVRLVDPFLQGQTAGFVRLPLPLGFRELRQTLVQQQPIFLGQLLDSLEDFLDGFTHGNTSEERGHSWLIDSRQFP